MPLTNCVVVTRHPALLDWLQENGMVPEGTPVIEHASPEDIQGKHVIGVLPLRLAKFAESVTEVPLDIPQDMRGQELSLEDVRRFAGQPAIYEVSMLA